MLGKKTGYPEEGELLSCTITSVQSHSVFVRIDDYGINGMIHISEVAPGRIRNIRDYVVESKSIICKVLRVNAERGHVDLSLRRVSDSQKRGKINEMKKEKLAEKIIEVTAENLSMEPKKLFEIVSEKTKEHFYLFFECFSQIAKGTFQIESLGLEKNIGDELKKIILDRLKPEIVVSKGKLHLSSYSPDGVDVVKSALKKSVEKGGNIKYLGGGTYLLTVEADNYKVAESKIQEAADAAVNYAKKHQGTGEFEEDES